MHKNNWKTGPEAGGTEAEAAEHIDNKTQNTFYNCSYNANIHACNNGGFT